MSTPIEPPTPDEASMPAAPAEPSSSSPATRGPSQLELSRQPGSGSRRLLAILLPIILMVLSLGGIGGVLLYANHQAATAPAQRFPGQYNGQRPSGFPSGARVRPSGAPSGGYPSGFPSGGGFNPSDFPSGGGFNPSDFPSGGNFPGGNFPGGNNGAFQRNRQAPAPGMHLSGLEIGLISGLGVIFVGSAVFLAVGLVNRRKEANGAHAQNQPAA